MMKSQDTILACPPVASQIAAAAALEVGRAYCVPYVSELAEMRDIVIAGCTSSSRSPACRRPTARSTVC